MRGKSQRKKKRQALLSPYCSRLTTLVAVQVLLVTIAVLLAIYPLIVGKEWSGSISSSKEAINRLNGLLQQSKALGLCYMNNALISYIGASCDNTTPYTEPADQGIVTRKYSYHDWDVLRSNFKFARSTQLIARNGQSSPVRPLLSIVMPLKSNVIMMCESLGEILRGLVHYYTEVILIHEARRNQEHLHECTTRMGDRFAVEMTFISTPGQIEFSTVFNRGVSRALGRVILLAQDDMFVTQGAIPLLIKTLAVYPSAGMVGPIVFGKKDLWQIKDGNFNSIVRQYEQDHSVAHEVDYISTVCLLTTKSLYIKLFGSDAEYRKAVYERDLALAVRKSGLRLVLQPLSVVYHSKKSTLGVSLEMKNLFLRTKNAFLDRKWQTFFGARDISGRLQADQVSDRKKRIFWVEETIFTPDLDSGSQRGWAMMNILLEGGYDVEFIPLIENFPSDAFRQVFAMQSAGVSVVQEIPSAESLCTYDFGIVSRISVAKKVFSKIQNRCPNLPVIFDTVDLHSLREIRMVMSRSFPTVMSLSESIMALKCIHENTQPLYRCLLQSVAHLSRYSNHREDNMPEEKVLRAVNDTLRNELAVIEASNLVFVVSEAEKRLLHQHFSVSESKVKLISNIYDDYRFHAAAVQAAKARKSGRSSSTLQQGLFVGNFFHAPNVEAIVFLISAVTSIRTQIPSFIINIVGSNQPPPALKRLIEVTEGIEYHGWLSDDALELLYSNVLCAFAPLRSGSGVKGKVVSAYLHNVPVIGTSLSVEGMGLQNNTSVLIADTVDEMTSAVSRLHQSQEFAHYIVRNGIEVLQDRFGYSFVKDQLLQALQTLDSNTEHPIRLDVSHGQHDAKKGKLI